MNMNFGPGEPADTDRRASRYQSIWGSFEVNDPVSARRSGMKRYHLEILPPGTNSAERRQLRRFRQWRLWGALVALVGQFLIGETLHSWQAPLYIAFAYLAGLAFGLQLTRRVRSAIHSLNVGAILVGGSTFVEGDIWLLENCVSEFEALDRNRLESSIGPVEYEAGWARLYARLAPAARPAAA
jgi:hypothetical protein